MGKTITEMKEQVTVLKEDATNILKVAQEEKRELTDVEQSAFDGKIAEIRGLDSEIKVREALLKAEGEALRNGRGGKPVEKRSFSLLRATRCILDGRPLEDAEAEVAERGRNDMLKSGCAYSGQIQLPCEPYEKRATIQATVTGAGIEVVQEDKLQILGPLYNQLALAQAGATILTNQVGNVSIPKYSGSSAVWAGETACHDGDEGTFSELAFAPKRLTATIEVSRQFLIQDNVGAENLLRYDLIQAIRGKMESTLLGNAAGTATQPAGLGSILTPVTIAAWGDIVAMESALQEANVGGEYRYVLSPYVSGATRTMAKDAGSGLFAQDVNKTIDGYPVLTTGNVFTRGGFVGNWAEYFIVQWGSLDLIIDQFTTANCGTVRFVINAYFDGKPRRNEAFQALQMADPTPPSGGGGGGGV